MNQNRVKANRNIGKDGIAVVHIRGVVVTNLEVTSIDGMVRELIAEMETPRIVLNLSSLDYLDSFSFGWIMNIYKEVRRKGGEFAMCSPNADIQYLLELTDFSRVVPVYPGEDDAREAIRTGNQSKRIVYI